MALEFDGYRFHLDVFEDFPVGRTICLGENIATVQHILNLGGQGYGGVYLAAKPEVGV